MPKIINIEDAKFEDKNTSIDFYKWMTSERYANIFGSKHLNFDFRKLAAGKFSFPFHFHRNDEELMFVIEGEMTMRTNDGFKICKKGDLIFIESGKDSAHQFYNHTESDCVYLDIRTTIGTDVVEYPDSGKVMIVPTFESFIKEGNTTNYNTGEDDLDKLKEKWGMSK